MTEELRNILHPPPIVASIPTLAMPHAGYPDAGHYGSEYSHSSAPHQPDHYPKHTTPFLSPIAQVLPQQPSGWSWTPQGGWIYRLSSDAPPPVVTSGSTLPIGYSPQQRLSSSSNAPSYDHWAYHPHDSEQRPQYPSPTPRRSLKTTDAGIHREQCVDPPSSVRRVRFRETPGFVPPRHHPPSSPSPSSPRIRSAPEDPNHATQSNKYTGAIYSDDYCERIYADSEQQIPPILRQAHERLLNFDEYEPELSGKPSGRVLVQELERVAEYSETRYTPPQRSQELEQNQHIYPYTDKIGKRSDGVRAIASNASFHFGSFSR